VVVEEVPFATLEKTVEVIPGVEVFGSDERRIVGRGGTERKEFRTNNKEPS